MLKFGSRGDNSVVYKCTVRLLEDTEILECEYKAHHKGKFLLEYVCQQLNLIEQDYLGLRYVDNFEQRIRIIYTKMNGIIEPLGQNFLATRTQLEDKHGVIRSFTYSLGKLAENVSNLDTGDLW